MSDFDCMAGPGLGSEDKRGNYFSLLPIELLYIVNDLYYYPVKISITSFSQGGFIELLIERMSGEREIDTISMTLQLSKLLESLRKGGRYKAGQFEIWLEGQEIKFICSNSADMIHITIQYDRYETKVFFNKLHRIQHEIKGYRSLGLSTLDIEEKIMRYIY